MIRFTASCDNEVLRRDIFKIKEMTWESMVEAVNMHEAVSRMESVTTVKNKQFKLNISDSRNEPATSTPSPFRQDTKPSNWSQDREKEKKNVVDGLRNDRERRGKESEEGRISRPKSRERVDVTCNRCNGWGHFSYDCTA